MGVAGGGSVALGENAFVGQNTLDPSLGIIHLRVAVNSPWSSVGATVSNLFPVTSTHPGSPAGFGPENQQFLTSKPTALAVGESVPVAGNGKPCDGDAAIVGSGVADAANVAVALGLQSREAT
jgi:hypothetical protein